MIFYLKFDRSSDKKVLSQRNISDAHGDPGSSNQNRRQSLSIKSNALVI